MCVFCVHVCVQMFPVREYVHLTAVAAAGPVTAAVCSQVPLLSVHCCAAHGCSLSDNTHTSQSPLLHAGDICAACVNVLGEDFASRACSVQIANLHFFPSVNYVRVFVLNLFHLIQVFYGFSLTLLHNAIVERLLLEWFCVL